MRRVHRQHRAAGGCVAAFQDQRPGLAAIRRLVDAAVVAVTPEFAGDAYVDGAGLVGIDEDLDDVLGLAQPHVGPVLAAVLRPVDAVAHRHAIPHPRFTRAHPHHLGVLRIDGHRADRLHRLPVEDRLERRAAIHRLPHAAARGADVDREPRALVYRRERRDAPAHRRRADVTGTEAGDRLGVHLDRGLLRDQEQEEEVHGRAPGRTNRVLWSGTLASILS